MADGVTTTTVSPAGLPDATEIATDDAGAAGHVQIVKLAIAADGSATVLPGDATDGLLVNLGANNDVTVAGVASAANQATEIASLSVLDDWDETDRAKVNVIAGQAGVAAGTGAVGASVQRVTLASDDPAVASLGTLDNAIAGNEMQVDVVGALPAGANNIGDVDVVSIPARARTTDTISAAIATDAIMQGTTVRTPAFAIIDAAASGDNTLLAAQGASNKIRVHQLFLVAGGTVTVRFESGAGGTALTGQQALVANTGFVLPFSPIGWFETAANTLLNLELSAAVSVDGSFAYTVVT